MKLKSIVLAGFLILSPKAVLFAGNVEGTIRYYNSDSTEMRAVKVLLSDNNDNIVDSAYTSNDGRFVFSNLPAGTYTVSAQPNHPWGGVNSADALQALKYFVGIQVLDAFTVTAADVNGNAAVNSLDALLIAQRFALLVDYFPSGDWLCENKACSIGENDTLDLVMYCLCYGDVNHSYLPDNNQFLICGDTLIDIRDNKHYATVQIGGQCWMKQNMDIGIFVAGTANQGNNGIIEKYCYDNDPLHCEVYGGLYQWTEMMQYVSTQETQGICPPDFHIPSNPEWEELINYLGGEAIAGGKMKETGFTYWNSPNTGATNESGFSGRGSGNRIGSGEFVNLNTEAKIWSSTQQNTNSALFWNLYHNTAVAEQNNHGKNNGIAVRCLKN
ncbi:MAG: FISUMP domain-containing protein [Bacteroidales bacterium]